MTHLKKTDSLQHNNKSLSVQVSLIGLSFLVKDVALNSVLFSHSVSFPSTISPNETLVALIKIVNDNTILQGDFEMVTVIHQNNLSTVVPSSLFDEHEAVNYLKFNAKILPTDFIAHDKLKMQELEIVYVPYVNINNYFYDTYGSFKYYHHSTIAIKDSFKLSGSKEITAMHIDVAEDTFYCTVMVQGKLQLHNVYTYKTAEDFSYYILFCFEQLGLDPNEIPLNISGKIAKNDVLYSLLFRYIRNIQFLDNAIITENSNTSTLYLLSKVSS